MFTNYQTRKLYVLFEVDQGNIHCTIYAKPKTIRAEQFRILQSYTMKRNGFKDLPWQNQLMVMRSMLKVMRNRMTVKLKSELASTT